MLHHFNEASNTENGIDGPLHFTLSGLCIAPTLTVEEEVTGQATGKHIFNCLLDAPLLILLFIGTGVCTIVIDNFTRNTILNNNHGQLGLAVLGNR